MVKQERREMVRRAYGRRCSYCGVHEEEAGSKLEIDHFRPRSAGGANELENLVYCCPTCNRLKGDFWADCDPLQTPHRLLHPKRDDVAQPCTQTIQLSAIRPFSSTGLSVATHCPASDTYRFVEKAECGLCVEPENPDALTLYHDPDRRERLGRSGRAYVEANG